jgi:hypothetical protein
LAADVESEVAGIDERLAGGKLIVLLVLLPLPPLVDCDEEVFIKFKYFEKLARVDEDAAAAVVVVDDDNTEFPPPIEVGLLEGIFDENDEAADEVA